MPKLVYSPAFEKSFKKFTKGNPTLKLQIFKTLELIESDPYSYQLRTHKLSGKLVGLVACSCGYDCRIVFSFEKQKGEKDDIILLIDIGSHDVVY
jgi:addiction module RelE/StbE family toxin